MQIRTRITLQFTIIVSCILLIFAVSVFYFSSNFRKEEFYERLKDKALTIAELFADIEHIDNNLIKKIDHNSSKSLAGEKIFIYDYDNVFIYCSLDEDRDEISRTVLKRIKDEGEIHYRIGDDEYLGLPFEGKFNRYLVVASAHDKYGISKLNYLGYSLFFGLLIGVALTFIYGLFFSRQALSPISDVVDQVENITISNLNLRVNEGNGTDEIAQLAIKFNKMLERLEAAFEMQRSFVANASHELRTPLTALTGELEVELMSANINSDTKKILQSLLDDIRQLNKLSNGLLELAQTDLDISELKLSDLRVDELLGSSRAELLKRNPEYHIELNLEEFPDDEKWLILSGNEQLLRSAMMNVIENACKYSSDHTTTISISCDPKRISIQIRDNGIGISPEEIQHVFEPFYRSETAKNQIGHGIGLTLVKKIVELHKGTVDIHSEVNKGTTAIITLLHL